MKLDSGRISSPAIHGRCGFPTQCATGPARIRTSDLTVISAGSRQRAASSLSRTRVECRSSCADCGGFVERSAQFESWVTCTAARRRVSRGPSRAVNSSASHVSSTPPPRTSRNKHCRQASTPAGSARRNSINAAFCCCCATSSFDLLPITPVLLRPKASDHDAARSVSSPDPQEAPVYTS